jgi:hypothetical protein
VAADGWFNSLFLTVFKGKQPLALRIVLENFWLGSETIRFEPLNSASWGLGSISFHFAMRRRTFSSALVSLGSLFVHLG